MKHLGKLKYLFLLITLVLLLNGFVFVIVGVLKSFMGYQEFFNFFAYQNHDARPGVLLVEGLDSFLIALVFIIFGFGFGQLFYFEAKTVEKLPTWMRVSTLRKLKILLWETILISLVVFSVSHIALNLEKSWAVLQIPIAIFILTLSLYIFGKLEDKDE